MFGEALWIKADILYGKYSRKKRSLIFIMAFAYFASCYYFRFIKNNYSTFQRPRRRFASSFSGGYILCSVHWRAGAAHGVAYGEAGARNQGHQQQQRRTDRGAHRETGEGPGHPRQEEKGRFSSEICIDYTYDVLLFSVVQRNILNVLRETLSQYIIFNRGGGGERGVCTLVIFSLATVMSCIGPSVRIGTKSPKVGPLLVFSISLVFMFYLSI